jgi:hypothetical protein
MLIGTVIPSVTLFAVFGFGWTFYGLGGHDRLDPLEIWFWAPFIGMCIFSLTTVLCIRLNLPVTEAWIVIAFYQLSAGS